MTGVPADAIRELAHAYARADARAALLDARDHRAPQRRRQRLRADQPRAADGHVGRYGSGLQPLRGQNNVQGGGDMGAIPNKLPGFQDVEDDAARAKFEAAWGATIPPEHGPAPDRHVRGDGARRRCSALYVIGENPAQSRGRPAARERAARRARPPRRAGHLPDEDRASSPTSSSRAAATLGEAEGTVTSSERRVQRVRKALDPPGEARDDVEIVYELARRLGARPRQRRAPRTSGTSCARSRRCTRA